MFIFTLAGHETSANTLTHALTLLALHPSFQACLQNELDSIFGTKEPSTWSYIDDLPKLLNGRVGALLDETLRLYAALSFFPKVALTDQTVTLADQTVTIEQKQYLIPKNTMIVINTAAAHRNPKYWPASSAQSQILPGDVFPYPVSQFAPERWLKDSEDRFDPPHGAYVPFSDGFRSCIGTKFAKVEFCVAVARILKEYSVELEGGVGKEEEAARRMSEGVWVEMALKVKDVVPLRFVKRGG